MTLQIGMAAPKGAREQPVRWADREGDRRAAPFLPGTSLPAAGPLPSVRIYQQARSVMQSGPGRRRWVLEFEPRARPRVDPLMGWFGGGDPLAQVRLEFPDPQSAIAFAEQHGWRYEVAEPPPRRARYRSYADELRYELAGAIQHAQPWSGVASSDPAAVVSSRPLDNRGSDGAKAISADGRAGDADTAPPDVVEEASRQSFPASDPPAWTGLAIA